MTRPVSTLVKQLRQRLDLTQAELARRLKVSLPTVSRWESGRSTPDALALHTLEQFVRAGGKNCADLLEHYLGDGKPVSGPSRRRSRHVADGIASERPAANGLDTKGMEGLLWRAACSIRGEKDAPKFPSLAEQQQIVEVIHALNRRQLAAEQTLRQISDLFSSMLHLLMTGQVRVPPEVIDGRPRPRREPRPEVIQAVVDRIVEAVAPEKIILFGSAAREEMGPDSDLDFLVVKACSSRREVATAVYRNLRSVGVPVDIVVVTPEDVERHKDTIGYVLRPALRDGRIVYAR